MKMIRKFLEFVGYIIIQGFCWIYNTLKRKINEWQCPNKKCGMEVLEEYVCCPYCGQKIKFKETAGKQRNGGMKMEIKENHCKVCSNILDVRKENVYQAEIKNSIFNTVSIWDAVDCPYCGCQNLLKQRYGKAGVDNSNASVF